MTKIRIALMAALGFLAAVLLIAEPASAGPFNAAKAVATTDQHADLHFVDRGSWRNKSYFKRKKNYFKGDHYYGGHDHKYYKKKKRRRAYRRGYDDGYYDGRRDRYFGRGYGYYYGHRPRFRNRGPYHRHRYGGYIKTPGFYFSF